MRFIQPFGRQARFCAQIFANALLFGALLGTGISAAAQTTPAIQPALGSSCTISALNRNAPVAQDNSFTIYNIPGSSGPFRARATCSDGTVGQTPVAFPEFGSTVVYTGDIVWGQLDPSPIALGLSAPSNRLSSAQTAQLGATAIAANATTRDVTPRAQGTNYTISNALLASISQDGLVQILPLFATGSSARLVTTATNEGGVAGSYMFILGPRGSLNGKVTRVDGTTPVAGAQVTVVRNQPMEQVGTVVTDGGGNYSLSDVNAGSFTLSVTDPATGDRGQLTSKIETEGEAKTADIKLNGQGQVIVTVTDATGNAIPNAAVTLTTLGGFRDSRIATTDGTGKATFNNVAAGELTVSTRDATTLQVGTALGLLPVGAILPITLKQQPVGTIKGTVFGVDGSTVQEGVQVRLLSRERGIVSQVVTGPDGQFSFNPLPISDGPFTLDAFVDGRLRARVPGVTLVNANQALTQDVRFSAVGTVRGVITDANSKPFSDVAITLQSLEGLRLMFTAQAGADGVFMIQGVTVGNFTIVATTKDGRTGNASTNLPSDGATVTTNLQLAASGLVGTVFQRDGVTPVGAGVTVYLQSHPTDAQLALTLNDKSQAVIGTATTNSQGQYAFAIATPDTYVLQVQDGDNRGRTQVVITTISPGQPVIANVTFLGKGSVSGIVRDGAGVLQVNIPVSVKSTGAFTNTWTTTTDAAGRYAMSNVFVGEVLVTAQNPTSRLAGIANGRMIAEGDSLSLDITLATTGSLQGTVLKSNGTTEASAPVLLQLYSGYSLIQSQTLTSGTSYQFTLVPVGDVTVIATEISTGDKGLSISKLTTANEARTLDVKLIGQGAVRIKVQDASNNPVAGVKVVVRSLSAFPIETTVTSDSTGIALVQPVFNGDVIVTATKPAQIGQISGSAQGTVVNGATIDIPVTVSSRLTGAITGIVFGPDGVTPRAGVVVALAPAPTAGSYKVSTDVNGKYVLPNIESGSTYTMTARLYDRGTNDRDRIRAQVTGLQITAQDQILTQNLQLIGSGKVSGIVTLTGGAPAPGITVTFNNPDPVYGFNPLGANGNYNTTTDTDGRYQFNDMAAGNFTLRAQNLANTLRAEAADKIKFDNDALSINLTLTDNAVSMPYTLNDANSMPFEISGDGSVINGMGGIFTGVAPDARGMRLDILVSNVAVPFKNGDGTIGRLTQDKQHIEVDETNVSGLTVTRRIYVPKQGYFARYLEVLENKTQSPITVDLRVTSNHSQSNSNPRVVDSSDGDSVLSVADPINRDRWVVVDDQQDADPFKSGSVPATGHIFDGEKASQQVDVAKYELVGQTGKLTWQWNSITVQPGQTAAFMHFAFNQLSRSRAHEAATRLAQLPPEAIAGLTNEDRAAIMNFAVPADGVSSLDALPTLDAGAITGKVLSGDGVTPIAGATVHFKSQHVLFGRDFYAMTDSLGSFAFNALTDGSASSMPIPQYAFGLDATHPVTSVTTAVALGDFAPGTATVAKDLIFSGTGNIRGMVTRPGGAIVAGASVTLRGGSIGYSMQTGVDGTYLMTGIPPASYSLFVTKAHPQQVCCGIEGNGNVTVVAASTALGDVTLEAVGSVTGIVRTASGVPAVGVPVQLTDSLDRLARQTVTDTAGRYRFSDVKTGSVTITANDPISSAGGTIKGMVTADVELTLDVTLKGFGTINVQVNFARGVPAPGSSVYYGSYQSGLKTTDSTGRVSYGLQIDTYAFTASHPDNTDSKLNGYGSATLTNSSDTASITITLQAAGAVKGSIVRQDGSTLAGGFPYTIKLLDGAANPARGGTSNAAGEYRMAGLGLGTYLITAYDAKQNRFADAEVVIKADGEEQVVNLVLQDNQMGLPANLFDANRFRFDVQKNGSLGVGTISGLYSNVQTFIGGAKLEVGGQSFTGDTSAILEAGKRQFVITQPTTLAGLTVTRKLYVPKGGYFARYLEIFENAGATPITVDAKVTTNYPQAQLIDSSTKALTVSAADNWVVLDDALDGDVLVTPQQPSTAHIFGQAGARVSADSVQLAAGANNTQQFAQQWRNLTVPAGGKVALMHFVVQQINRNGAQAASIRLSQLAPEAIDSLSPSDIAAIANFNVPADGTSSVPSLPALTSNISGRVVEGDGVTGVNNVHATVQSKHPLFNRVWGMQPDNTCYANGTAINNLVSGNPLPNSAYSVQGILSDTDSVAIPVDSEVRIVAQEGQSCFNTYIGHSFTRIPSRSYVLPGAAAVKQNILFDTGILTGTVRGSADFSVTSGRVWRATDNPDNLSVRVEQDGTYVFPGLPPKAYDLLSDTPHPQGSGLRGERLGAVATLGQTTITDIPLQATSTISGTVLSASGQPIANTRVVLAGAAAGQQYDACATCVSAYAPNKGKQAVSRVVNSDSLGRYSFSAVPVGAYTITVTDPVYGLQKQIALNTSDGTSVVQNVVFLAVASLRVVVQDGDNGNLLVAGAEVYVTDSRNANKYFGVTDSAGVITATGIMEGSVTIRAKRTLNQTVSETYATLTLTSADDAKVRDVSMKFMQSAAGAKIFTFGRESHLYSVPVKVGDVISIMTGGDIVNGTKAAYEVYASLSDPAKTRVAEGAAYGPAQNYQQWNYYGNLLSTTAAASGNYAISTQSDYYDKQYLGGYRLIVNVNGTTVKPQPYLDGGTVLGTVVRADGVTPAANQTVEVSTGYSPYLQVRTKTAADGSYQFTGVPFGPVYVSLVDPTSDRYLNGTSKQLDASSPVLVVNLTASILSTLQVSVQLSPSLSIPTSLDVLVDDLVQNGRTVGSVTFIGGVRTSTTLTVPTFGDTVRVYTQYPGNTSIASSKSIQAVDGKTIPVSLTLATAGVTGKVFYSTGLPAPGQTVTATGDGIYLTTTTNAQGIYQFTSLPAGHLITLSAASPINKVWSILRVTPIPGSTLPDQNLSFVGSGTLTGQVRNTAGTPLSKWSISVMYPINDSGNTTTVSGTTDVNGNFSFGNLPVSTTLTVSASTPYPFPPKIQTAMATIAVDGGTANIPIVMDTGPTLHIRVVDSDGNLIPASFALYWLKPPNVNFGTYIGSTNTGTFDVYNLPIGATYNFFLGSTWYSNLSVNITESRIYSADIVLNKVAGTVRFADGGIVTNPSVSVATTSTSFYSQTSGVQGDYAVFGIQTGPFTVTAQDRVSGLKGTATGSASTAQTVIADVMLQASGTVKGVLRDRLNNPVAGAQVYVRSSNLYLDRSVVTGVDGSYQVDHVAVGDITVQAQDKTTKFVAIANAPLTADGQILTVDLSLPASGTVSGIVMSAGGTTPAANIRVSLSSVLRSSAFGTYQVSTTTDVNGAYQFGVAPIDEVIVMTSSAIGTGIVKADSPTVVNLTMGATVPCNYILTGMDNFTFDLNCLGSLGYGTNNAYGGTYLLKIPDDGYPFTGLNTFTGLGAMRLQTAGRELVSGPQGWRRLSVTRRIFVPVVGGYARYLDSLTNYSSSDITIPVSVTGSVGSYDSTRVVVSPSSVNNRYAVTDDSSVSTRPVLAHVFGGVGALLQVSATQFSDNNSGAISYSWNVTIPAGRKVSLMHFAVQKQGGNSTAAQTAAEALSNMTDPDMFTGMSGEDKASVLNFAVPQ